MASSTNGGHRCAACKNEATKRCSRCKMVYYCTEQCQKKDWPLHKSSCVTKSIVPAPVSQPKTVRGLLLPEDATKPKWVDVPCQYASDGPNIFYKYPNYAMFLGGDGIEYSSRRRFFPAYDYNEDLMTSTGNDGDPYFENPGPYHHGTFTIFFRAIANARLPGRLCDPRKCMLPDPTESKPNQCVKSMQRGGSSFDWRGPILVLESDGMFLDPSPERKFVDVRKQHLHELEEFLMHQVWDF